MSTTKAPPTNPYRAVIMGEAGNRYADLQEAWEVIRALLAEGDQTRDELIAATGLSNRVVKAMTYHARQAGCIRVVTVTRKTEVSPGLWTAFMARGYRAVVEEDAP